MNHLGVFAKYWQPGGVKTRLAASIGHENAADLYREFVRQTLVRQSNSGDSRSVFVWPADRKSDFHGLAADSWSVESQTDGDLGLRMLDFFQRTLGDGRTRSVLIGSDSPRLPAGLVQQAFQILDSNPIVLGPSQDGGYYLIGMSKRAWNVFDGVAWSLPQVFQQTAKILADQNLKWQRLPEHNDVDDIDDLRVLEQQLIGIADRDQLDQDLLDAIRAFGVVAHD